MIKNIIIGLLLLGISFQLIGVFDLPSSFQSIIEPEMVWCLSEQHGSFHQIPKVLGNVASTLQGIPGALPPFYRRAVGIYFNSPNEVAESELHWMIGYVCDPEHVQPSHGLKIFKIPQMSAVETAFPWRNMFSPYLAVSRSYPSLTRYLEKVQLPFHAPAVEFYDSDEANNVITIRFVNYQVAQFVTIFQN